MLKLPKVPYTMEKDQLAEIPLRGINYSDMIKDGDVADSFGISMRRYPFVTNRRGRRASDYDVESAFAYNGELLTAKKSNALYYGISPLGIFEDAPKQYASVNSKVVMMPSKKYADFDGYGAGDGSLIIKPLEAELEAPSVTFRENAIDIGYGIKGSAWGGWFDAVEKSFRIVAVSKFICKQVRVGGNVIETVSESDASNRFDDYLKEGDQIRIENDRIENKMFTVTSVSADCIEISENLGDETKYDSFKIMIKPKTSSLSEILAPGDIVKIEGSSLNTDNYTIKEVQENEIIFADDETIFNEAVPNTVRLKIGVSGDHNVFSSFKEGDGVTVSGCSEDFKDNNISFVIDKIDGGSIFASANIFKAGEEKNTVTISRRIPKLDYICEAENRLWGCSNDENTIYISALGDPTNMYTYEGVSTDSFATAVGSPGRFTGCCRYSSSVLFFKEDKIHKILGSCPADYTLYSYDVEGIQAGSERSAVVINEVLYYKGVHGIYAYDGGVPTLISECFGEKTFCEAVAGTDGVSYYVSMHDAESKWYLFAYNTATGIWTLEDKGFHAKDALRIGMELYFLDNDGVLWKENAVNDVSQSEWMMQFTPFYETIQGKKIYSRLLLRAELSKGSYMVVEIRCDGGRWMELGKIVGKSDGVVPVRIPVNRCDKFEIRLRGKGEFLLREMLREYYVSSEK